MSLDLFRNQISIRLTRATPAHLWGLIQPTVASAYTSQFWEQSSQISLDLTITHICRICSKKWLSTTSGHLRRSTHRCVTTRCTASFMELRYCRITTTFSRRTHSKKTGSDRRSWTNSEALEPWKVAKTSQTSITSEKAWANQVTWITVPKSLLSTLVNRVKRPLRPMRADTIASLKT